MGQVHGKSGGEHLGKDHQVGGRLRPFAFKGGLELGPVRLGVLPHEVRLDSDDAQRCLDSGWGIVSRGWHPWRFVFEGDGFEARDGVVEGLVFFGKAQADRRFPARPEGVHGDGGDAVVPGPSTCEVAVCFAGLQVTTYTHNLEIATFRGGPGQPCAFKAPQQAVAFGFVDGPHRTEMVLRLLCGQVRDESSLEGRARGEHVVLMDFSKFPCDRLRGGQPPNLPAGGVKELAKTSRHEGA